MAEAGFHTTSLLSHQQEELRALESGPFRKIQPFINIL